MRSTHDMNMANPDWVMLGVPCPDGRVYLIASTELNRAELEAQAEHAFLLDDPHVTRPLTTSLRYVLTAELRKFVVVEAADYPAAFKHLFDHWTPKPAARPEITEGQRELDA